MSNSNKPKLKDEQLRALDISTMKNIIVSAQAGAGKTFVLTKRIIELLEKERKLNNNIDIDNFLIVTFTNKASYEMKDRIKKAMYEKPKEIKEEFYDEGKPLSEKEFNEIQKFYQKQYNKTINAQISTMHSFGINILRKYFYKLGLNPNFKLLTDASLDVLQWETMNEVFDKFYRAEDENFYKLISIYATKYDDISIMNILFDIYTFIRSQIAPFKWLREKIDEIPSKDFFNSDENINIYLSNMVLEAKQSLMDDLNKAFDIIENIKLLSDTPIKQKYMDLILEDENFLKNLSTLSTYDDFYKFNNISFKRLPPINKKFLESNNICESDKEKIKSMVDSYRNIFKKKKYIEFSKEEEIEAVIQMKESLETIYNILLEYDNKLNLSKKNMNSLDFNDIEHYLLKLLEDEQVLKEIKKKYKYIFFDEYQDANLIQNEIVNLISREDNLFFVGDIKQSIYKFRLADPKIFKNRYDDYKINDSLHEAIDLHHNFRSHENLLKFNNYIFDNIMTEQLGDVNYKLDNHGLQKGFDEYDESLSHVELDYILNMEKEEKSSLNDEFDDEILENKSEAIFIAKKIAQLIKEGKKPSDIAVLARSRPILDQVKDNLIRLKVPFFYESSKFSYEDIEVKSFIEILKAIDNDNDDITLLSALTSILGNFTDEELAKIRGNDKNHSFNYCFYNYQKREDLDINILEKINLYKSKIQRYRNLSKLRSIEEFAWFVFVDSGYMSYVLSKDDGDKKVEEINLLLEEIGELENQTFFTLSSLVRYIDSITKRNLNERESFAKLSEKDNVVRLMTIHKSKGLQFDTVFVVGLSKRFNKKDLSKKIIISDEYGIALNTLNPNNYKFIKPFLFRKIEKVKERELLSEEMRILYVALTRAINRLYLVSTMKEIDTKDENSYLEMNSFNDWIFNVFNKHIFKENELDLEMLQSFNKKEGFNLKVEIVDEYDMYEYISNIENTNTNDDMKYFDDLEVMKILDFKYDRSLIKVPYKKTVTELSSKDDNTSIDFLEPEHITEDEYSEIIENEMSINYKKPKFVESLASDPLEKGSLYHFIFEKLPIKYMEKREIEGFLLTLLNNKFITQKEYDFIDIKYIENFMKSDLFNRLLNADKVFKERSFTMKYEEDSHTVLVDGQIDLYFIEGDSISILDFKSNRVINEDIYKKQLDLYKVGIEKAFNLKVKDKLIYWIMHDKVSYIN